MRVAVTTTRRRFEEIAPAFREVHLDPIPMPCIAVEPASERMLTAVRAAGATATDVLVSSARTIDVVWPRCLPDAVFHAVGSRTAAAVSDRGGAVGTVGRAGLAELVEQLAAVRPERVAFPHADGTDLSVLEPLRRAGTEIEEWIVYTTRPVVPSDDPVDAVAFASPSAVDGWFGTRTTDGLVVGAIGPTTAAAIVRRGIGVDVVPTRPGYAELAGALAAHAAGKENRPWNR